MIAKLLWLLNRASVTHFRTREAAYSKTMQNLYKSRKRLTETFLKVAEGFLKAALRSLKRVTEESSKCFHSGEKIF
jgi:hypothetical protein